MCRPRLVRKDRDRVFELLTRFAPTASGATDGIWG
jgi:hypothetical protein